MKKKLFSFIFAVVFVIASTGLSFSSHAIVPGEDAAPNTTSITYGQIQELIEEYFDAQQIELSFGTELFYQYAFNQVHEAADQTLVTHPAYEQILTYLTKYMVMYQDYLIMSDAIEQNAASATLFDGNPCLIYDDITNELRFVLTDEFLSKTLAESKAENEAMLAAAALAFSQRSTTNSVSSYSPTNAINYAYSYVSSDGTETYSPIYPSYPGADCTNYVSQCIKYGGITMDAGNSTSGIHDSTTQWYCNRLSSSSYSLSSSWVRVFDFYTYMSNRSNETYVFDTLDDLYKYCRPGDVVQLMRRSDSQKYHTIIISKKDWQTAKYCGHSNARRDADIFEHLDEETTKFVLHTFLPITPIPGYTLTDCGVCGAVPSNVYHQSSISYDRVIPCPLHNELHDAQEVYTTYYTYCSAHNRLLGSGTEMSGYECLD